MATIRKHGKPTPKTTGAVGDIYVDLDNGNTYKCTFSYSDSGLSETHDWKLIGVEDIPRGKRADTSPIDEKVDIPDDTIKEALTETETEVEDIKPTRTNYNKQYKKR